MAMPMTRVKEKDLKWVFKWSKLELYVPRILEHRRAPNKLHVQHGLPHFHYGALVSPPTHALGNVSLSVKVTLTALNKEVTPVWKWNGNEVAWQARPCDLHATCFTAVLKVNKRKSHEIVSFTCYSRALPITRRFPSTLLLVISLHQQGKRHACEIPNLGGKIVECMRRYRQLIKWRNKKEAAQETEW